MADFFIKSILSLGVLYVFFLLVLSHIKTFHFNRFFLLGSLAFSLAIPFISIPVNDTALPIIQSAGKVSLSSTIEYSGEFIASKEVEQNPMISYLPYFYAAISLILLLRFSVNLFSIAKTIIKNQKIKKAGFSIVLLSNQIIPYSFFRYVLVNEKQYQAGTIDEALIQHEISHCRQWHSLDILFVELMKVVFWINPFIWLMKKSVQLNHEFLADNKVLLNHDLANYKNLLVNLVIKHNSGILISNFNFSFTKQRLKMMTKPFYSKKAMALNIAAFAVICLVGYTFTNFQVVSDDEKNNSEVIVNTDKFDYLIGMEYDDKNGLDGLTRKTRLWTTHKNGEMIGETHFASNSYRIVTSERFTKNEESNITVHHIYDVLVLSDNYKTCTGCFQSKINKDRILSIHPVSGVTKDTIHAAFKIDQKTLKYQPVDYSNYEWVHKERTPWKEIEEMKKRFEDKKK
jgi:hypothetical protein